MQVTGIRKDAYANALRVSIEEHKAEGERGKYLHPVELGKDPSLSLRGATTQVEREQ